MSICCKSADVNYIQTDVNHGETHSCMININVIYMIVGIYCIDHSSLQLNKNNFDVNYFDIDLLLGKTHFVTSN